MTVAQLEHHANVSVHRYRNGDEVRIVPFLQRCMGWPAVKARVPPVEHWRWKFLGNPLGFHLVCWAEQDGEVVSHSASLPMLMKVGDDEVLASQGVDLCTDPSHRGRGIISRTMECRNGMKEERGVALDFGFPNHAAYRLSLLKQGFTDLGIEVTQHRYIVNEGRFFRKVPFGQIKRIGYGSYRMVRQSLRRRTDFGNGLELGHEETFGPDVDDLYREASADFDLMVARGHDYLNWRFGDPRGGDFIIRTARRDGRLVGYMVHKLEERDGTTNLNIVDALVRPGQMDVLTALVADVVAMANDLCIDTVLCCLPDDHPYGKELSEEGFLAEVRYTGDRPMSMIYLPRTLGQDSLDLLTKPDLRTHIMLGDTDWV